jgi:hypothetical protein
MSGQIIGASVGVAFGCGWGIVGATGLRSPWRVWLGVLSVVISAALIVALAMSDPHRQSGTFRGDVYGIAVTFEAICIFAAVWQLRYARGVDCDPWGAFLLSPVIAHLLMGVRPSCRIDSRIVNPVRDRVNSARAEAGGWF